MPLVVGEGHWGAKLLGLFSSMPFSGGAHFGKMRSCRPNNNHVGSQPCPSVNRLPKDPLGTQPPLFSPRDKAPPTRGIGISSTYQWAGISPSQQEAYSKPPYQLQSQGGQTPEVREATTLLSEKRSPHQKPIKMKRQRTRTQMREKGKTPENQLSDQEILSLQEKDFRLLMLKMMQDIGNKLEAKMDNLQETLSKEMQDIKLKQEEMQNTITEIKNSLEAANSRIQEAEERISEVGDQLVVIKDAEQKREERLKTNEESLRELWDNVKCTNIRIIGVPEGEEREKGTEKLLEEIIAKNFPNMGKEPLTQIQEAQREPYKINPRGGIH
uniref:L1 transposable element RRM domain-containing protein n=1 Tax=Sus scrofa TaxID=9823 RepID=A0A8D0V6K8_PIG